MMNALVPKAPESGTMSYNEIAMLGDAIAKSGLFGIKTKDQAIALMMIAHAEGRHPALAARDYDVIQGKPAKKSEAMMRDFIQAGGKVEWHTLSDTKADATFTHPQTGSVRIDWDMARAATAGFAGKDNWKKFPRSMLRSRVVSEGVRTIWPLATSGMYVPEEAADFTGQTIDHTEEPEPDAREVLNASVPIRPAAAAPVRQERKVAPVAHPLDEQDGGKWLRNLESLLVNAASQDEVVEIAGHHSVGTATAKAPAPVKARISELLATAYGKYAEADADASHEPADAA
jgi:hypothetical protein